jgi:trehalose-6-phosphatase
MLSEFSTASHVLNSNLLLNPWGISSVAREMDRALLMPDHERSFRQWRDYRYAVRNPAGSWSRTVILDAIECYTDREASMGRALECAVVAAPAAAAGAGGVGAGAAAGAGERPISTPAAAAAAQCVAVALSDAGVTPAPGPASTAAAVSVPAAAPGGVSPASAAAATLTAAVPAPGAPGGPPLVVPEALQGVTTPSGLVMLPVQELVRAYLSARRRVLIVDYGGTLMGKEKEAWTGSASTSDFTIDGYSKQLPPPVLDALASLSADPANTLYVISGLRTAAIDALHLSRLPRVGLAAENGMLVSQPRRAGSGAGSTGSGSGSSARGLTPAAQPPPSASSAASAATAASAAGQAVAYQLHERLGTPTPTSLQATLHGASWSGSDLHAAGLGGAAPTAAAAAGGRAGPAGPAGLVGGQAAQGYNGSATGTGEGAGSGDGSGDAGSAGTSTPASGVMQMSSPTLPISSAWPTAAAPASMTHGCGAAGGAAGVAASSVSSASAAAAAAEAAVAPFSPPALSGPDGLVAPYSAYTAGASGRPGSPIRSALRHAAAFAPPRRWAPAARQSEAAEAQWRGVKRKALALMQDYTWRVNGSVVREYQYLLAWDFRNADAEWAQTQARFLAADVASFAPEASVRVSMRKTQVEVSLRAMDKGMFVLQVLGTVNAAAAASAAAAAACGVCAARLPTSAGAAALSAAGGVGDRIRGERGQHDSHHDAHGDSGLHDGSLAPAPAAGILTRAISSGSATSSSSAPSAAGTAPGAVADAAAAGRGGSDDGASGSGGTLAGEVDFLLVAGDDVTDEEMFGAAAGVEEDEAAAAAGAAAGDAASGDAVGIDDRVVAVAGGAGALSGGAASTTAGGTGAGGGTGAAGHRRRGCQVYSIFVGRPGDVGSRARYTLPNAASMQALLRALDYYAKQQAQQQQGQHRA